MAQTVNIAPVVIEQDNSLQYMGQMLANTAKEKRAQQLAVQQSILKQRNANDAIFGADSRDLREYYEKSKTLAPSEADRIFSEGIAALSKIPKDSPDFRRQSSSIVNNAFGALKTLGQTFADTDMVIDEATKAGRKINPDAVRRLAATSMYEYIPATEEIILGLQSGVIPPPNGRTRDEAINDAKTTGQLKRLKSTSELQNFGANLKAEIDAHPELYADRGGVKQEAVASIAKLMSQASKVDTDLELDPTGTKTTKLGVSYLKSMFDKEVKETDKTTGLQYSRPKLNTTALAGIYYKGGDVVSALGEEEFKLLMNTGGRAVQEEIMIGTLENMRDHNAEVFRRAGMPDPDKLALTISKNNVASFRNIPGFIDPFDEGQIEYFQRATAADLLTQSGKYDDQGYVTGFSLKSGVNKANPKSGVTVNVGQTGPNFVGGKIPAYQNLLRALNAGEDPMKSTKIDSNVKNALLRIADANSVLRTTGKKVPPSMVEVKFAPDGSVGLYMKGSGDPIATLSEQSFDMEVNEFSSKAQGNAASGGQGDPAKSNVKWKK